MEYQGKSAGTINFRNSSNEEIDLYAGNIGYNVDPLQRGRRFAERSCRLLFPFIRSCGFEQIWITCDPENVASRRTCENLGARFVEIVDLPEGNRQKCRYLLSLI